MNEVSKYPAIVKWHRDTGSHSVYIREQVERARQSNAPADAIFQRDDKTWATVSGLAPDHDFRLWWESQERAA